MEIERRAEARGANCGEAGCDWLRPRPRPPGLDMGIYWRRARQSAPHLINEPPEHCVDPQFHTSAPLFLRPADRVCNRYREESLRFCVTCFFFFPFWNARGVEKVQERGVYLLLLRVEIKQGCFSLHRNRGETAD